MSVVWGLIGGVLGVFEIIIDKNIYSTAGRARIPQIGLYMLSCFSVVVLCFIINIFLPKGIAIEFSSYLVFGVLILIASSSILTFIQTILVQYALTNEKISVIAPFQKAGDIFTIILGFLFFKASIYAFIFGLIASILIFISGINFKKLVFNKYCMFLIVSGLVESLNRILALYIIFKVTEFTLIIGESAIGFLILLPFLIFRKELFKFIKKIKILILIQSPITELLWVCVYFISLYLIKEIGLVSSCLIKILMTLVTLFASYIFYKDKPSKKDIIVNFLVTILVLFGLYL